MPLFPTLKGKREKQSLSKVEPKEIRKADTPSVGRYEVLDEYNIIPQTVSVEISWNPNTMEAMYVINEPVMSEEEEDLLKRITKNMEQTVKNSKNLPDDLSTVTIDKVINNAFLLDEMSDTQVYSGFSYAMRKIADKEGTYESEIEKEIVLRSEVLDRMIEKGITNFKDFFYMINQFYKNRTKVFQSLDMAEYIQP